jgi:hypothetical protein
MEAISKHKAVRHAEPVGLHWMIGPIINIPNIAIVKIRNSVLGRHGVACRRAEAYQSQELPSFLIG